MSVNTELLNQSKKGLAIGSIIAVVVAAIGLSIGLWVLSISFGSVSQTGWSAAANTTFATIQNNTWSAFNLMSVAIIVMAFGVIVLAFMFGNK
jgi:hypothetical protein